MFDPENNLLKSMYLKNSGIDIQVHVHFSDDFDCQNNNNSDNNSSNNNNNNNSFNFN